MTAQLSVGMDEEYPGGSQEMAAEATASSPIAPLSLSLFLARGKLGKNKNTAPPPPAPSLSARAFSSRAAPSGWTSEGADAAARRGVAGLTGALIVRGNGPEVINRARLLP